MRRSASRSTFRCGNFHCDAAQSGKYSLAQGNRQAHLKRAGPHLLELKEHLGGAELEFSEGVGVPKTRRRVGWGPELAAVDRWGVLVPSDQRQGPVMAQWESEQRDRPEWGWGYEHNLGGDAIPGREQDQSSGDSRHIHTSPAGQSD